MFKYLIVFFLMLIIILFPIPIKITLKYSNKVLEIFIYNKKINIKKSLKGNKISKTNKTNEANGKSKQGFFKSLIPNNSNNVKLIIYKLKNLKFKPTLILNAKIEYGLDDAALVAIIYGFLNSAYSFLHILLLNFVKVKNMNINVIPHFEENDLYIEILSLTYINFAKIIYIVFKILPSLITINHNKSNMKQYKGGNVHG